MSAAFNCVHCAQTDVVCIPRYASLYFCVCIEAEDNELLTLEIIHRYVELLDKYFGNVSHMELVTAAVCEANCDTLRSAHKLFSVVCTVVLLLFA